MKKLSFAIAALLAAPAIFAETPVGEAGTPAEGLVTNARSGFGSWRVSAGGVIGFGLKTKLGFSVPGSYYAAPTSPRVGTPSEIADRLAAGERVEFLDGAFIDPNGSFDAPYTQNWRLPVSQLNTATGAMTFNSTQMNANGISGHGSDDACAYGASIELSRTLYAHEDGYGVDLALAFSMMRMNKCFNAKSSGTYMGNSSYVYTPSSGSSNEEILKSGYLQENDGFYGLGQSEGFGPVLDWSDFGVGSMTYASSAAPYTISATGDYEEFEFALMLRPWWEVTDYWRLTGTLGVGLTRSEFDYAVHASFGDGGRYSAHRSYDDWNCYGIAGLGTVVRVWKKVDISLDFLARFCQDDMHIHNETVNGTIEKPSYMLRIAVGYEF